MNARDNSPLRAKIADRLAAGEDTAAGIASAIGKGDTPSIVVKELNAMRTDGQVECERWRAAHPDKLAVARKRTTFKNRRSPILDPIAAALLGYTRRGTGWVKHQNRNL